MGRVPGVLLVVGVVVLVTLGGSTAVTARVSVAAAVPPAGSPGVDDDAPDVPPPPAVAAVPSLSPSPSALPSRSPTPRPRHSSTPTRRPSPTPVHTTTSPSSGGGATLGVYGVGYRIATGGTGVVGSGATLKRYEVAVQDGLSETPASVAATVDSVLDNTGQGWLASGLWRFERVSSGPVDFIVELTTAADTDLICGKYGINTAGVVSCRGGPNVVINLTRWRNGTNGTTEGSTFYSPSDYRVLVINHEVGHALGHHHVTCGAAGTPAPVMMTQYFGLAGCTPNIWVYVGGTYITGPPAT